MWDRSPKSRSAGHISIKSRRMGSKVRSGKPRNVGQVMGQTRKLLCTLRVCTWIVSVTTADVDVHGDVIHSLWYTAGLDHLYRRRRY